MNNLSFPQHMNLAAAVAAVVVWTACPCGTVPFLVTALFCALAVAYGLLAITVQRNPVLGVVVPPILVLSGIFATLLAARFIGSDEASLVQRATACSLSLLVLAAFCTSRRLSRLLAVLVVVAPTLLLAYSAKAQIVAHMPGAEMWQVDAALLLGVSVVAVVWSAIASLLGIPQTLHEVIGIKAIDAALALPSPTDAKHALQLINGWIDPRDRFKAHIDRFLAASTAEDRKLALAELIQMIADGPRVLTCESREALAEITARPDATIVLAEDDFVRRQTAEGLVRLAAVLEDLSPDAEWLVNAALGSWDRHVGQASPEIQDALWRQTQAQADDSRLALVALAMIALNTGLPTEVLSALGNRSCEPAKALLQGCQDIWAGRAVDSLNSVHLWLTELPGAVVRNRLLSVLCAAAANAPPAQQTFFAEDDRPQLLELTEAPLTSIYGGRIACWTFLKDSSSEMSSENYQVGMPGRFRRPRTVPTKFAVTGHGPTAVCARVSAILSSLAEERDCPTDLILAGTSFFDLTADVSHAAGHTELDNGGLEQRIIALAKNLDVGDEMQEYIRGEGAELLTGFRRDVLEPTVENTHKALAAVEADMGFVVNTDVDAQELENATGTLETGGAYTASSSFPVLVEHRHRGNPLRVRIPVQCIGIREFEHVAVTYRQSVRREIGQELARRRRKYEEWSKQFAASYRSILDELTNGGVAALESRTIYIHYNVDLETATETRLDPPQPITELEYLVRLPAMLTQQLAFWAWTTFRSEKLAEQEEFAPHWARTCLVDAFLRGWPLPTDDEHLNAARVEWQDTWRPLALCTLDGALAEQGLSLSQIAAENTIFKVEDAEEDDDFLSLSVLHVWDPFHDAAPDLKGQAAIFQSAFGKRRRCLSAARDAQLEAAETMGRALAGTQVDALAACRALAIDSGKAVDLLAEHLCRPYIRADLDDQIAEVLRLVRSKIDPLTDLRVRERFVECSTLAEVISLALECGEEGRKKGPPPDFLAWELFLAGVAMRNVAANARNHAGSSTRLPAGVELEDILAVADYTPWRVVRAVVEGGQEAGVMESLLQIVMPSHQHSGDDPGPFRGRRPAPKKRSVTAEPSASVSMNGSRLRHTYELLAERDKAYASACLQSDGPPPESRERRAQYAPWCLTDQDRVVLDIAQGDTAFSFAWDIGHGRDSLTQERLLEKLGIVEQTDVPAFFESLRSCRTRLIESLRNVKTRCDRVSLGAASGHISEAVAEAAAIAESSYLHAVERDTQTGCAILRLARFKWLTAHYREALSALIGPPAAADLAACRLPFALAVRAAGGKLEPRAMGADKWNGPDGGVFEVVRAPQSLMLRLLLDSDIVGECAVSELCEADITLLEEFFTRYRPDMLLSCGAASFEEWASLIRVPNLGPLAATAQALQGETQQAVLTAMVYLAVPEVLARPPYEDAAARPAQWLAESVVTAVEWEGRRKQKMGTGAHEVIDETERKWEAE